MTFPFLSFFDGTDRKAESYYLCQKPEAKSLEVEDEEEEAYHEFDCNISRYMIAMTMAVRETAGEIYGHPFDKQRIFFVLFLDKQRDLLQV